MTSQVEQIGPEQARAYLTVNVRNRLQRAEKDWLADRHVRDLAAQMIAGNWRCTGETLKFDAEGNLIDGQHRLWAVILSGATINILVVRGVEDGAFAVIDQGKKRHSSQFRTEKYKEAIDTGARYLWQIEHHLTYANSVNPAAWSRLDIAEKLAYGDSWPELADHAAAASAIARPTSVVQVPYRLLLPVVAQAARTEFAWRVESFLAGLHEGTSAVDPRMVLRKRLVGAEPGATSWSDVGYSLVVKTWNAYVTGAVIKQLKMAPGERRAVVLGSGHAADQEPIVGSKKTTLELVA